ncbi:transposase [Halomonas binhaiensis]|uniref:Transposase n=1 Tax=Halomonas binhaiensis TaxID=2562282 RepID=A0A5C1NIA6_9GAMM|nr:transposase [Halomonas binhaiensis]QEM82491.1 transposase [Halomonas binhaiensis]
MRVSRFTENQILSIINAARSGKTVKHVCQESGISEATYYNWKRKFGRAESTDIKKIKDMEAEISQLRRVHEKLIHENQALKEIIEKKL